MAAAANTNASDIIINSDEEARDILQQASQLAENAQNFANQAKQQSTNQNGIYPNAKTKTNANEANYYATMARTYVEKANTYFAIKYFNEDNIQKAINHATRATRIAQNIQNNNNKNQTSKKALNNASNSLKIVVKVLQYFARKAPGPGARAEAGAGPGARATSTGAGGPRGAGGPGGVLSGGAGGPGGVPPGGAGGPGAVALDDPAVVFRVINQQIKDLIKQIQGKLGGSNQERNQEIRNIVLTLEDINGQIRNVGTVFSDNAVKITQDPATQNYRADKNGTYRNATNPNYSDATGNNIGNFINNTNYVTDAAGSVLLSHGAESININSIEDDIPAVQTLPTVGEDIDLTDGNIQTVQKRLINCQYLEILYLVKHEELMKTFAFLLTLYDKYQYAIKLLLFILKNLLDFQCPVQTPPGTPGEPHEPVPRRIKLPKVLIRNIKDLLKDQKQVQDIIGQMKTKLYDDNNTQALRHLQVPIPPGSKTLRETNPAGLDNQVNPNPPR